MAGCRATLPIKAQAGEEGGKRRAKSLAARNSQLP
jgi:hypothetical protein